MKKVIMLCLVLVIVNIISGQTDSKLIVGIIPFDLKEHIIIVKAKINNSEEKYNFIVDTGGRTFLDKETAQKLQLKQKGYQAKIDTLTLAGFNIENIFCFTTFDLKSFEKGIGIKLYGMIGSDLMERFKVILDYTKRTIIFSRDTAFISDFDKGILLKFRNHPVNFSPLVKFTLNQNMVVEGMIDTGHPYAIVLPLDYIEKLKVPGDTDWIKSKGFIVKWPAVSSEENYLSRIKSFEIDKLRINNMVCLFAELPELLSIPLLGKEFLSQFQIIINYPRDEILLVPNDNVSFKDNHFSGGLNPSKNETNEIIVRGIWTDSPADKAGICVGDTIIKFNSKDATGANLSDLRHLLQDNNVNSIDLEIRKGKGQRKIKLEKEMLF
jgi:predicted aspartyl protease